MTLTFKEMDNLLETPSDEISNEEIMAMKAAVQRFSTTANSMFGFSIEKRLTVATIRKHQRYRLKLEKKLWCCANPMCRQRMKLRDVTDLMPEFWSINSCSGDTLLDKEYHALLSVIFVNPLAAYSHIFQRNNRNASVKSRLKRVLFELLMPILGDYVHPLNKRLSELLDTRTDADKKQSRAMARMVCEVHRNDVAERCKSLQSQ